MSPQFKHILVVLIVILKVSSNKYLYLVLFKLSPICEKNISRNVLPSFVSLREISDLKKPQNL